MLSMINMNVYEVTSCKNDDPGQPVIRNIAAERLSDISECYYESCKDERINRVDISHDSIIVIVSTDSI